MSYSNPTSAFRRSLRSACLFAGFAAATFVSGTIAEAHGGDAGAFKGAASTGSGKVVVSDDVQKALGIIVAPVVERQLPDDLLASGQIEALPSNSIEVNAPVSGRLLALTIQRGSIVSAGQQIAVLDSPEIRALAVDAQRAGEQGQAQLEQARARLRLSESSLRREQTLLAAGIAARKDLDVAQADLGTARAEYAAASSQIALASSALSSRLSSLGQNGVRATSDGRIIVRSTTGGTVVDQSVTSGQSVEAGKTLAKIVDTSRVAITGHIFEKDVSKIRVGEPVETTVQSFPGRVFLGVVSSIDPVFDGDTRTVSVRSTIVNPSGALKPAMFASMRFIVGAGGSPVVVIPRSAILDLDSRPIVFVKNGDAFQSTPVTLGRTSGSFVEVTDGVFAGDYVVTQRAFQLRAELLKGPPAGADDHDTPAPTAIAKSGTPTWIWIVALASIAGIAFFGGRISRSGSSRGSTRGDTGEKRYS